MTLIWLLESDSNPCAFHQQPQCHMMVRSKDYVDQYLCWECCWRPAPESRHWMAAARWGTQRDRRPVTTSPQPDLGTTQNISLLRILAKPGGPCARGSVAAVIMLMQLLKNLPRNFRGSRLFSSHCFCGICQGTSTDLITCSFFLATWTGYLLLTVTGSLACRYLGLY